MAYLNEVKLIGNLGKDPEVRVLPNGELVMNVGMATTRRSKDKDSGQTKERTEWHQLVAFGALADIFRKYTKKGALVYVSGELRSRKWMDRDSVERTTMEVYVDSMQRLSHAMDSTPGEDPGAGFPSAPTDASAPPKPRPARQARSGKEG